MATEKDEEKDLQQPQEPAPRDPEKISVDLSEEDDEEDHQPQTAAEDRRTRRAYRRELKEELARVKEQLSELQTRQAQPAPPQYIPQPIYQPAPQPMADPVDAEIQDIGLRQEALNLAVLAKNLTEEKVSQLTAQWHKLEQDKQRLIIRSEIRRQGLDRREEAPDPVVIGRQILNSEFPDIYGDPVALRLADAELMRMTRSGRPNNLATAREAAARVRDQIKPATRPAPTAAERSRYTSVPSRAGGGAGRQEFSPSKAQLTSARAMYDHLDIPDEEKVRLWARNVGQKTGLLKNGA